MRAPPLNDPDLIHASQLHSRPAPTPFSVSHDLIFAERDSQACCCPLLAVSSARTACTSTAGPSTLDTQPSKSAHSTEGRGSKQVSMSFAPGEARLKCLASSITSESVRECPSTTRLTRTPLSRKCTCSGVAEWTGWPTTRKTAARLASKRRSRPIERMALCSLGVFDERSLERPCPMEGIADVLTAVDIYPLPRNLCSSANTACALRTRSYVR